MILSQFIVNEPLLDSQKLRNFKKKQRKKHSGDQKRHLKKYRRCHYCISQASKSCIHAFIKKVNQIHKNQQTIEAQLKKQQELMTQFRSHQQVWVDLYEQLNRALMKAGDLAHYAGYVQAEIKELVGEGTVAQFLEESEKELYEERSSTKVFQKMENSSKEV